MVKVLRYCWHHAHTRETKDESARRSTRETRRVSLLAEWARPATIILCARYDRNDTQGDVYEMRTMANCCEPDGG